jgi:Fic family protein
MQERFNKISQLYLEINKISPNKKWDKIFFEEVKINFTYHSNKLENNKLTYGQTLLFLKNIQNAIAPKGEPVKDYTDMKQHFMVLDHVYQMFDTPFSVEDIKELHYKLMQNPNSWDEDNIYSPGKFKTDFNYAYDSNGKEIKFVDPDFVVEELQKLITTANERVEKRDFDTHDLHPIVTATYFHNRYLEIHPFNDGNGRTARILTNKILLKSDLPPIFISTEINRNNYLKTFENGSSNNLEPMLKLLSDQLIESLYKKKQFVTEGIGFKSDF